MSGIVVFDDAPELTVRGGDSHRSIMVADTELDLMVLDSDLDRSVIEVPSIEDFVVLDVPKTISEVLEAEPEVLVIDPLEAPGVVVEDDGEPVLVVQSGGRQGPPGPPGEPGLDGVGAYLQEFNFASPQTVWTCVHNQDTFALNAEAFDLSGDLIDVELDYVDSNTIEFTWYYPTAGMARVFR